MPRRRSTLSHAGGWIAAAAVLFAGCDPAALLGAAPAQTERGIVGGTEVTVGDWPAVGAYLAGEGSSFGLCTATLVAPDVVLTAAHCTEQTGAGDFYFHGHDVTDMPLAERYPVAGFAVHPDYDVDPDDPRDIALVFLEEPLAGIEPIPVNVTPFTDEWLGTWLHFVGYGDGTGYNQGDVGVKRETDIELDAYWEHDFYHYTPGTNVCGGDSGGPGLVDLDGVWHVAGVNKAVHVHADQEGNDPCDGFGWDMRVDAELDFLGQYIELPELPGDDDAGDDDAGDDDGDDGDDDDAGGTGCSCRADTPAGAGPASLLGLLAAVLLGLAHWRATR